MNILETIRLAISAILRNRLRSFLTILGIVIGVLSVIVLIALVNGLQSYITGQISGFGSNLIFVVPGSLNGGRGPEEHQSIDFNLMMSQQLKELFHQIVK